MCVCVCVLRPSPCPISPMFPEPVLKASGVLCYISLICCPFCCLCQGFSGENWAAGDWARFGKFICHRRLLLTFIKMSARRRRRRKGTAHGFSEASDLHRGRCDLPIKKTSFICELIISRLDQLWYNSRKMSVLWENFRQRPADGRFGRARRWLPADKKFHHHSYSFLWLCMYYGLWTVCLAVGVEFEYDRKRGLG